MEDLIVEAREIWKAGDPTRAVALLDNPALKDNPEAIFLRGEIHYNNQEWGAALNSFRRCLQLDDSFKAARTYIDLILNILGYFHTDQFNP